MPSERRQTRRSELHVPVSLCVEDGPTLKVSTGDVSPTGVFVETTEPLQVGIDVVLVFNGTTFPQPLTVHGHVRRVLERGQKTRGVGIKLDFRPFESAEQDRFREGIRQALRAKKTPPQGIPALKDHYLQTECDGCGWRGEVSKFMRRCPRCGCGV